MSAFLHEQLYLTTCWFLEVKTSLLGGTLLITGSATCPAFHGQESSTKPIPFLRQNSQDCHSLYIKIFNNAVPQKNELGSCTRNQPNNSELSLLKVRTCAPKIAIFRGKPHGIQLVSKHFQPHRWENWRLSTTSSWRLVGLQNVPSRPCSIVTPNKITMFNKKFSELNGSWFPWWS
jgi:hypothetical protein